MKLNHVPHPAEALILAKISSTVQERARQVRMMIFDVDGVLTDGGLWYGEHGEIMKGFNALDGHGLRLLRESGITLALRSEDRRVGKEAVVTGGSRVARTSVNRETKI